MQRRVLYFTSAQHSGYAELTKAGLSLVVRPGIKKSRCALRELHKQQKKDVMLRCQVLDANEPE